jgi:hypothetical protein
MQKTRFISEERVFATSFSMKKDGARAMSYGLSLRIFVLFYLIFSPLGIRV